jgi:hypothetical protein
VTQPLSQVMNRLACVSHLFTDNWPGYLRGGRAFSDFESGNQ